MYFIDPYFEISYFFFACSEPKCSFKPRRLYRLFSVPYSLNIPIISSFGSNINSSSQLTYVTPNVFTFIDQHNIFFLCFNFFKLPIISTSIMPYLGEVEEVNCSAAVQWQCRVRGWTDEMSELRNFVLVIMIIWFFDFLWGAGKQNELQFFGAAGLNRAKIRRVLIFMIGWDISRWFAGGMSLRGCGWVRRGLLYEILHEGDELFLGLGFWFHAILLNNINKYNNYVREVNFDRFVDNVAASGHDFLRIPAHFLSQNEIAQAIDIADGWGIQEEAHLAKAHSKVNW